MADEQVFGAGSVQLPTVGVGLVPVLGLTRAFGLAEIKRFRVDIGNLVRQVEQTGVGVQKTSKERNFTKKVSDFERYRQRERGKEIRLNVLLT